MSVRGYRKKKIIAMIPARMGSKRLAMKNLALLNGKPLIYYAVKKAKESGVFERIVINSESTLFAKIAKRYNVEFYHRPAKWATSGAKSDFVVYDFIQKNPCDIIVWVNPISPLQTGKEIKRVVDYFIKNKLGSLITVKNEQAHCIYKGKAVNFRKKKVFAKTQDLTPVQPFVYSVMMWRTDIFTCAFKKHGHAFFCGKTGFYPVSKRSSIIIKRKEDLILVDSLMRAIAKNKNHKILYDSVIDKEVKVK